MRVHVSQEHPHNIGHSVPVAAAPLQIGLQDTQLRVLTQAQSVAHFQLQNIQAQCVLEVSAKTYEESATAP